MRQTVVGVFDRYAAAQRAVQALQDSGFGPDAVHVTEQAGESGGTDRVDAEGEVRRGDESFTEKIRHFFADLFGPDDEREVTQYSDALRRGCAVVKVDVEEDESVDAARQALQDAGALDIEEQARGPLGGDAASSTMTGAGAAPTSPDRQSYSAVTDQIGLEPQGTTVGGVRVYPGDRAMAASATRREQVVQEERASLQGRLGQGVEDTDSSDIGEPASDAAMLGQGDTGSTRLGESSMGGMRMDAGTGSARRDQPGMSREDLRNDAIGSAGLGAGMGSANVGQSPGGGMGVDSDYQRHFEMTYGDGGERYDDYEPAYRYGSSMARDARYAGRSWDEVEADARRDWERTHPESAWDRFKAAVRHAWDRAVH